MPSIRTDKQIFPFFDSVKNPVGQAGTSESFHNNGFESLTLEISGSTAIEASVEGCINILNVDGTTKADNECEWTKLAIVNMNNFDVVEKMTQKGIYNIGIGGTARIRVVITSITGQATITGVAGA